MVSLMKTLLAIGDKRDRDSFMKFFNQRRLFKKHNFVFKTANYNSAIKGKFPKIKTKHLIVFLFFPFNYWERNIETKKSEDVYGNGFIASSIITSCFINSLKNFLLFVKSINFQP